MTLSSPQLRPLDIADPSTVSRWLDLHEAIAEHDFPHHPVQTPALLAAGLAVPSPDSSTREWLWWEDGEAVGGCRATLFLKENGSLCQGSVYVHPRHRRRGMGTALLEHLESFAAEQGRSVVSGWPPLALGAAENDTVGPFAERTGYERALSGKVRRNVLAETMGPGLARKEAAALPKAEGYRITGWAGPVPEKYAAGYAALESRMLADQPTGSWVREDSEYDVDRIRAGERIERRRGLTAVHTIAVQERTGEVAGHTQLWVIPGEEKWANQGITIVDPAHRGRQLGLLMKVANQRRLRSLRPGIERVFSANANANAPMAAVNDALGYEVFGGSAVFQKRLDGGNGQ
ncbi:GNAT family N-acetyltransferase [Salininema proteolyticum]|uniref:GNAT family N-acetyltransferase n=1 Tax=Salininema proteolyticum TaxID=1607685 RepID=A0ABV8U4B4_9ACTN